MDYEVITEPEREPELLAQVPPERRGPEPVQPEPVREPALAQAPEPGRPLEPAVGPG
jgi:hypothetical protein